MNAREGRAALPLACQAVRHCSRDQFGFALCSPFPTQLPTRNGRKAVLPCNLGHM